MERVITIPCDQFFLARVERIADTIGTEPEKVRLSMGAALMGIGKCTPLPSTSSSI